jgi:hypothetical protein
MVIIFPVLQQGHCSTSKPIIRFVISCQEGFSFFTIDTPIFIAGDFVRHHSKIQRHVRYASAVVDDLLLLFCAIVARSMNW